MKLKNNKKTYIILFLTGQFLDLITTIIAIRFFNFSEGNPIMNKFSLLEISIIKVLVISLLAIVISTKNFYLWFYKAITIITFMPVVINTYQIISTLI